MNLSEYLKAIPDPGGVAPPSPPPKIPKDTKGDEYAEWLNTKIEYEKYLASVRRYSLAQFCINVVDKPHLVTDRERDRTLLTLCLLVLNPAPQDLISKMTGVADIKLPSS